MHPMKDKPSGTVLSINATTWHDNEEVDRAINHRLATLIRYGRLEEERVQGRPDLFKAAVCEVLAGCVATMPVVQRAMALAYPDAPGIDGAERSRIVIRKIAELFEVDADPMIQAMQPKTLEPAPVFVAPRDPATN